MSAGTTGHAFVIGCVGKPSVGKSTFFNAVTESKAKTGNFPFTTIEPNTGVTYYRTKCPSVSRGKQAQCVPRYGRLRDDGTRFIPVRLLDVAGLVPGASQGEGLGNKFLNDLCGADVLVHIVDVSGTTNEKGEATTGYDPLNDADWLVGELNDWVFGNLWNRWASISRRHAATKASAVTSLLNQLSGYGAPRELIIRMLNDLRVKDPVDLASWDEERVREVVDAFVRLRFPMVLLLNKADYAGREANGSGGGGEEGGGGGAGETDRNIQRIVDKFEGRGVPCIVGSAAAEVFLKAAKKKRYIKYLEGADHFDTLQDEQDELDFCRSRGETTDTELPQSVVDYYTRPEPKIARRLERIKDMVMYRFGGTGVWAAVQTAVELKHPAVCYPVRSLVNLSTESSGGGGVLADALLLRQGTTVRQAAALLSPHLAECFSFAEGEDGRRLGEDAVITGTDFIVKFIARETPPPAPPAAGGGGGNARKPPEPKANSAASAASAAEAS